MSVRAAKVGSESILTVRNKYHNELFQIWLCLQKILDLIKHVHEVSSATGSELVYLSRVVVNVTLAERCNTRVVIHGVELFEWALIWFILIVFFTNEFGSEFECFDRGTRHRSRGVKGLNHNLILADMDSWISISIHTCHPRVLLIIDLESELGE